MQNGTLKSALTVAVTAAILTFTVAIGVGTYLAYRWFTDTQLVSSETDGRTRAKVIQATLYARNDLRVGQLSGLVQGVGQASRVWGWLKSSQVIKAPFKVDYYIPLNRLKLNDFHFDSGMGALLITAPEPIFEPANIDLANATLNNVSGVFVTRGAMTELTKKTAQSARSVAGERAGQPENRAKVREFAREALQRLFGGVLGATGLTTRVEVRFPGDPAPGDREQWNMSRSLEDVLRKR